MVSVFSAECVEDLPCVRFACVVGLFVGACDGAEGAAASCVFFRGSGGVEGLCDGFASVDRCALGVEALCEVIYEFVHVILLLFVLVVEWIIF